ncbi:hypothetical protein B0H12DRAFT_306283 [Mycena haematopus]|nr:hypothetical protein B0H12DRAFT_306283 [Mycena haematopus]
MLSSAGLFSNCILSVRILMLAPRISHSPISYPKLEDGTSLSLVIFAPPSSKLVRRFWRRLAVKSSLYVGNKGCADATPAPLSFSMYVTGIRLSYYSIVIYLGRALCLLEAGVNMG